MNITAPYVRNDSISPSDNIVASIIISRDVTKVWTDDGEEHYVTSESFRECEYNLTRCVAIRFSNSAISPQKRNSMGFY